MPQRWSDATFQELTTGRVSVSGHGITAPPARDLPEPSLSVLAHSPPQEHQDGPARDGCAAAAVAFPELDGIRLAILGLYTCLGDIIVHLHARGPMCDAVYGPDDLYSCPVIWIRDNGGHGHATRTRLAVAGRWNQDIYSKQPGMSGTMT